MTAACAAKQVPARRRSPALLALVFGAFLAVVGVTAAAEAVLVSTHLATTTLTSAVGNDAALLRVLAGGSLTPADLDPAGLTQVRRDEVGAILASVVSRDGMVRAEVRTPAGDLLFSSQPNAGSPSAPDGFARAARGESSASIVTRLDGAQVLAESLPIISDGHVLAVFDIDRDAVPILAEIDATRREVLAVTLSGALVAAALLFLIFRSAQRRLTRQTNELLEATRRDAQTGSLNHGALVVALTEALDAATTGTVAVALVDVDGFRLLNDSYGHGVGDKVLLEISRRVAAGAPPGSTVGRYGPDEVLVIAPGVPAVEMATAMDDVREGLRSWGLPGDEGTTVPVTVSAGIAEFPNAADSVTALLTVCAQALAGAKSSGGDAVQLAAPPSSTSGVASTFSVLQGLVFAIDTKDRYTRRHSEEVARYADIIADRAGVSPELRRAVRLSGLLHDVGKIGIPDDLLRKPARLTPEEQLVFRQHVALGDHIVHGLPDIDIVRQGVRHHHERWDGRGYLDSLAGEDIPQIARILAVADAFSAMTTDRPYRKGFPMREALRRLGEVAGSQLDEHLVALFTAAMEDMGELPPPAEAAWRKRIWTPLGQVA